MSSELQLDVCCRSCCGGDIWWTLTKEKQAWCYLQVILCDPRLSALSVVATIKALDKYTSFLFSFSPRICGPPGSPGPWCLDCCLPLEGREMTTGQSAVTLCGWGVKAGLIDWVGFNVPLNPLWVISGTGFYGSNDPTDSVRALKEVVVLRIGFNLTRSTLPCYNITRACNIQWCT